MSWNLSGHDKETLGCPLSQTFLGKIVTDMQARWHTTGIPGQPGRPVTKAKKKKEEEKVNRVKLTFFKKNLVPFSG